MIQHFTELRARLIHCVMVLAAAFVCCYCFSNNIYKIITTPILQRLAPDLQIITTQVTAPFMVPLQLCFFVALILCAPYLLYQLWMFVKPGLYAHERRNIAPVIIISTILFYAISDYAEHSFVHLLLFYRLYKSGLAFVKTNNLYCGFKQLNLDVNLGLTA